MVLTHRFKQPSLSTAPCVHSLTLEQTRASVAATRAAELPPLRYSRARYVSHPEMAQLAADHIRSIFKGQVSYAVKANPDPEVLRALSRGQITHFDVASLEEIDLVRQVLPHAQLCFMHPVKTAEVIEEAYARCGVRVFAVDAEEELNKILAVLARYPEIKDQTSVYVRIAVPRRHAQIDLSEKFGASHDQAVKLLQKAHKYRSPAKTRCEFEFEFGIDDQRKLNLGITFHVGSQCLDPDDYIQAAELANAIADQAQVPVQLLNVGGGFPVEYTEPVLPLDTFFATIVEHVKTLSHLKNATLFIEPGRALVADCAFIVATVQARRERALYLNTGVHSDMADAGPQFSWRYKVYLVPQGPDRLRPARVDPTLLQPFVFYGDSCDGADYMPGPFMLPEDVRVGDKVVIRPLGAYGRAFRTSFGRGSAVKEDETLLVSALAP